MAAAGLGPATYTPRQPRGVRAVSSEEAVRVLHEAGADINATNEANFTALHGAAFRGMNEVIEYLVAHGADIDARDFRGRTAYRMAEGSKQSFQFQSWPETAEPCSPSSARTPGSGFPARCRSACATFPRRRTTETERRSLQLPSHGCRLRAASSETAPSGTPSRAITPRGGTSGSSAYG